MSAQTTTKRDLRLSPAQDATLETAAKAAGMDVQAFVRFILSQHVSGFVDELPRRKTHGKRVGARKRLFVNCDERYGGNEVCTISDYYKLETNDEVTFEAHRDEIWRLSQNRDGYQVVEIVAKRKAVQS